LENQVLVSTSALEEGFDYPSIRAVIYLNLPYSFIGFLQGSGRGGRDSRESIAIIFYNPRDRLENPSDSLDKSYSRKYLREAVCLRRVISYYLDQVIIDSCSSKQEECICCLDRKQVQEGIISSLKSFNTSVEGRREWFKEQLFLLSKRCIYCFISFKDYNHPLSSCSLYSLLESPYKGIAFSINSLKKRQSLSKDSCCFNCYLPTLICTSLKESRPSSTSAACLYPTLVVRVLTILYKEKENPLIKDRFNIGLRADLGDMAWKSVFKVYIKDLDTEGIQGVQVFFNILQERLYKE